MPATREDADLILKLYDMRREAVMRKARHFMVAEYYAENVQQFMEKYPPGTDQNAYFRQALTYWDMVGAFVNKGLLDAELLFETAAEYYIYWNKARAVVYDLRKARNLPFYMRNLEDMAGAYKAHMEARSPGCTAFFDSMNRPPSVPARKKPAKRKKKGSR